MRGEAGHMSRLAAFQEALISAFLSRAANLSRCHGQSRRGLLLTRRFRCAPDGISLRGALGAGGP